MGINNIRGSLSSNMGKEDKKTMKEKLRNALGTSFLVISLSACVDGWGSSSNNNEPTNTTKDAATIEVIDDAVKNGEFDVKTLTGKDIFDETLKTDENGQIVLTQSQVDKIKTNINDEGLTDSDWIIFLSNWWSDNQWDIQWTFSLMLKVSDLNWLSWTQTFRVTPTSTFIKESTIKSWDSAYSDKISDLVSEWDIWDINWDWNQDRKDVFEYDPDVEDSDIESTIREKDFLSNIRDWEDITSDMVENVEASMGMMIKQIKDFPSFEDKEWRWLDINLWDYFEGKDLTYRIKKDNTWWGFYLDSNWNLKWTHPSVSTKTTNNIELTVSDINNNSKDFSIDITTFDISDDIPLTIDEITWNDIIQRWNVATYSTKITDSDGILSSKITLKDDNWNIVTTISLNPDANWNVSYDLDTWNLWLISWTYNLIFSAEWVDGWEWNMSWKKEVSKTIEINEVPNIDISASSTGGTINEDPYDLWVDWTAFYSRTIDVDLTNSNDVDGNIVKMEILSDKRWELYSGSNLTTSFDRGSVSTYEVETLTFVLYDDDGDTSSVNREIVWDD